MGCKYPGDCVCKKRPPKTKKRAEGDWNIQNPELKKKYGCFWNYLLNNDRPHTLEEIAKFEGISISAVVTLEKKALKKMTKRSKCLKIQ